MKKQISTIHGFRSAALLAIVFLLLANPTKGYVKTFDHYMIDLETVFSQVLPAAGGL